MNPEPELSFEEALGRLEALVEGLEGGDLPLAEALAKFEEGMTLKALCARKLQEAEAKVEEWKAAAAEE